MKTLNRVKSIIMALAVAVSISTSLNVSAESEYANIEPISYTDTESRLVSCKQCMAYITKFSADETKR